MEHFPAADISLSLYYENIQRRLTAGELLRFDGLKRCAPFEASHVP